MANTRDTIGDQATIDGLVNRTLTSLEESKVVKLADYALYMNTAIEDVTFPALTKIGDYALSGCSSLRTVTAPNLSTIGRCTFEGSGQLTNITLDNVVEIDGGAFRKTAIGQLVLPNCTRLCKSSSSSLAYGTRLGLVDFGKQVSVGGALQGASSLTAIILRSSTLCTCENSSFGNGGAAQNTPLYAGVGYIYVPADLVDSYKSATNWSAYASQIVPISEYPKALQDETITDTWEQIFAAEENGTYSAKYSVGDVKYISIGGTPVAMQIVAMDTDELTSGGTAKITWISRGLFDQHIFKSASGENWEYSSVRNWLRSTIYNQLDTVLKSGIKEVVKTYWDHNTSSTLAANDTLWIPSYRELFGSGSYETYGAVYTNFFVDNNSRIKRNGLGLNSEQGTWLVRGSATYDNAIVITNAGSSIQTYNGSRGVALGFCT